MSFNSLVSATVGGLRGPAADTSELRSQTALALAGASRAAVAASQVAALMQGAVVTPPVEMLRAAALSLCIAANERAGTGDLPHGWVGPGGGYSNNGQWVWDSAFTAIAMASMGQAAQAQVYLSSWPAHQLANGMLPITITASKAADDTSKSQAPVLARAVWKIYEQTQDKAFLALMLPCLKAWDGWWETARGDGTGLFSWGNSDPNADDGHVSLNAREESGQDNCIGWLTNQYAQMRGNLVDHCSPDLCGWLADAADHIALIAAELGAAADRATYQAKADARRTALNTLMWDDEQGCYQMVVRSELAAALGATSGNAAAGAMSVTLSSATTTPIHKGAKIVMGSVVAQAGADVQIGVTAIPLLVGLSAPVAGGTAAQLRTLLYCKRLSNHVAPMMAGAPSQVQARRIVDEHLFYSFDGQTVDTCKVYLGSKWSLGGAGQSVTKYKHYPVDAPKLPTGATIQADRWTQPTVGGGLVMGNARNTSDDARRPFANYRRDWETCTPARPAQLAVDYFASSAGGNVQVYVTDTDTNSLQINDVLPAPAGAVDGALVQVRSRSLTGGYLPWQIVIIRENNGGYSGALSIQAFEYSAQPKGFVWASPSGLLANARLSNNSIALETNSDPALGAAGDYWAGDHWINLEYVAVLALLRYGMTMEAAETGRRVVARVAAELTRTGNIWERYTMRGQAVGEKPYAWSALVVTIAQSVGLA